MSRRYHLTLAEQETVILWDNELDTASVYTHDQRLINKLKHSPINIRISTDWNGAGRSGL